VYPKAKNYCYPLVNARKNASSRITAGREYLSVKLDVDTNDPSDPFSPGLSLSLKARFEERSAEIGTKTISNVCQLVLELLHQLQEHVDAFPIILRANWLEDVLGLPRRRIYDVLHILQAIGLLSKRVSSDGLLCQGHMYLGEALVVPTILTMQESVLRLKKNYKENTDQTPQFMDIVDESIGEYSENQEKIPALSSATHKFIKFMIANGNSILRNAIHTIEDAAHDQQAKRNPPLKKVEKRIIVPANGKGRRIYDVLAVLIQCNIVQTHNECGVKYLLLNRKLLNPNGSFSVFEKNLNEEISVPKKISKRPSSEKYNDTFAAAPLLVAFMQQSPLFETNNASQEDWSDRASYRSPQSSMTANVPSMDLERPFKKVKFTPRVESQKVQPCRDMSLCELFGCEKSLSGCRCCWFENSVVSKRVTNSHWNSLLQLGTSILDVWTETSGSKKLPSTMECYEGISTVDNFIQMQ
jgi:hypothetical protein